MHAARHGPTSGGGACTRAQTRTVLGVLHRVRKDSGLAGGQRCDVGVVLRDERRGPWGAELVRLVAVPLDGPLHSAARRAPCQRAQKGALAACWRPEDQRETALQRHATRG